MEEFSNKRNKENPQPCIAQAPGRQIQEAGQQPKKHTGAYAQQDAFQGMSAHKGRKQLIHGHYIAGAGLPHAGQSKDGAQGNRLRQAHQRPGQQNGDVGKGNGNGLHMQIAQKGEGHQQLQGDQGPQQVKPHTSVISLRSHVHSTLPSHCSGDFPRLACSMALLSTSAAYVRTQARPSLFSFVPAYSSCILLLRFFPVRSFF